MSSILLNGSNENIAICANYMTNYKDLCCGSAVDDLSCHNELQKIQLTTKYYTAELMVMKMPTEVTMEDFDIANVVGSAEGLLIIGASARKTINDLEKCEMFQSIRYSDKPNLAVRLFVTVEGNNNDDLDESLKQDLVLWALDHGFEHIEISRDDPVQGWQEREKSGLPRLMEALESTMWSSMTVRPATTTTATTTSSTASSAARTRINTCQQHSYSSSYSCQYEMSDTMSEMSPHQSQADCWVTEHHDQLQQFDTDTAAAHTSLSLSVDASEVETLTLHSNDMTLRDCSGSGIAEPQSQSQPIDHDGDHNEEVVGAAGHDGDDDEDEDGPVEQQMKHLTTYLNQAREARAQAMAGHLTDEQRRTQAASLAMKLQTMLMFHGDDESDDSLDYEER